MFRIVREGMGAFLNPPDHPEHTYSIVDSHGYMSLSYALKQDYVEEPVKEEIKRLLYNWERHKKCLADPLVQDWIYRVLGYFKNCYKNPNISDDTAWHADKLLISSAMVPMLNVDTHAGIRLIRQYYPAYQPCQSDFDNAYWGKKPCSID